MNLVTLKFIQEKLKISRSQAWRIFGRGRKGMMAEDKVLSILNGHRVNMDVLGFIPADLASLEELEVRVDGSPLSQKRLLEWVKRDDIPHLKFSTHLIRVPRTQFNHWVENFDRRQP